MTFAVKRIFIALSFACLVTLGITLGQARAEDDNTGATSTRFCVIPGGLVSLDDIGGWSFDSDVVGSTSLRPCITSQRTLDSDRVATLSASYVAGTYSPSNESLSGLSAEDVKAMQIRKGDPITVSGVEFTVTKLFSQSLNVDKGYFSFAIGKAGDGFIVISLHSQTREGHDKNYQPFRDWVRTFRRPLQNSGVAH